jgi:hypothetical protein
MMKTRHLLPAAAFVFTAIAATSPAAQAPHSAEDLEKDATHIVSGKVVAVENKTVAARGGIGFRNTNYEIQIELESVDKGAGVKKGDTITVHAWRPARSLRPRPPGLQGHSDIPAKGGRVKVFLKKNGEKYLVIHPNGFEPVKA